MHFIVYIILAMLKTQGHVAYNAEIVKEVVIDS